MNKKSSSKKEKKKEKKKAEQAGGPDYRYITEEEMKKGFKPSNVLQEGAVLCPYCSTTNTTDDEVCFNCRKKLRGYDDLKDLMDKEYFVDEEDDKKKKKKTKG
ncbi:MAG: hypothetical protein H7641_07145 [Candidatus Heimdallarchaeota archaeon]|nr:hypothetical protein [Candidatus Heimdallarchaeota archaeon]MCK4877340.1 hypothetical protein [Candidatus Heimdallarchaeota archaeon]